MIEHELNNYWQTVVNAIQEGVMIVDTNGTIVSANQALGRITGYPKEELIGKPCTILNCDRCEIVRSENKNHWCKLFVAGDLKMIRCVLTKKTAATPMPLRMPLCFMTGKARRWVLLKP